MTERIEYYLRRHPLVAERESFVSKMMQKDSIYLCVPCHWEAALSIFGGTAYRYREHGSSTGCPCRISCAHRAKQVAHSQSVGVYVCIDWITAVGRSTSRIFDNFSRVIYGMDLRDSSLFLRRELHCISTLSVGALSISVCQKTYRLATFGFIYGLFGSDRPSDPLGTRFIFYWKIQNYQDENSRMWLVEQFSDP
jgi:hypothetical protein